MMFVSSKKNVKKNLAELVGTDVSKFGDLVKKVMEIKGLTREEVCNGTNMLRATFSKMMDKSKKPRLDIVVYVAFGLGLQHEDFYWFLSQANLGLSCLKAFDRVMKSYVDRGYERWEVKGFAEADMFDPWWEEKDRMIRMGLAA